MRDMTPGGWILASSWDAGSQCGVMLPVRAKGAPGNSSLAPDATGVDDFSIKSTNPGEAVKDKIWIMAPINGEANTVTLKAPLNAETPLALSAPGVKFNGQNEIILTSESNTFTVSGESGATDRTGQEFPAVLKFGDKKSLSQPIGVKLIRKRIVPVVIYKVTANHANGTPDIAVNAGEIETYLNKVYGPQVNITFNMVNGPDLIVDWDINHNGVLDAGMSMQSSEQQACLAGMPDNSNNYAIKIFLISSEKYITYNAAGIALPNLNACWIYARNTGIVSSSTIQRTIAHEIGHLFFGGGHASDLVGDTVLPGTNPLARLMCGGGKNAAGVRLVKREWDLAEEWLKTQESNHKIPN
jgi:hypothetical protein